jgi:hypothetical protein
MSKPVSCLAIAMLCLLTACRIESIMRSASQEKAFRRQYVDRTWYTAIVIQPYVYGNDYLIDLTGQVAEIDTALLRASIAVPLGAPLHLIDITERHILARIDGYDRLFRILVHTQRGVVEDVAQELRLLIAATPPLEAVRPEIRPFIVRQELTQGMSQQEVYMSWGQPDKVYDSPGASGLIEQWVYYGRRSHLYLQNGILTNWQEF